MTKVEVFELINSENALEDFRTKVGAGSNLQDDSEAKSVLVVFSRLFAYAFQSVIGCEYFSDSSSEQEVHVVKDLGHPAPKFFSPLVGLITKQHLFRT